MWWASFSYDFWIERTNPDMIPQVVFVTEHFRTIRTLEIGGLRMHDQHVFPHVTFIRSTFAAQVAFVMHFVADLNGSQEEKNFFLVNVT